MWNLKKQLPWVFSVWGDPLMSVPLVASVLYETVNHAFSLQDGEDFDSSGISKNQLIYLGALAITFLAVYPGQILVAYKKNKNITQDVNCSALKKALRGTAITYISFSDGCASYLLANRIIGDEEKLSVPSLLYGGSVFALTLLCCQVFFNSDSIYNKPFRFDHVFSEKLAKIAIYGTSSVYALAATTPFAAAKISECRGNTECAALFSLVAIMTGGEFLRMTPSMLNFARLLDSPKPNPGNIQKSICYTTAAIKTLLTMATVSEYPIAAKAIIWGTLTPGVAFFQFNACLPPLDFKIEDKEADIEEMDNIFSVDEEEEGIKRNIVLV